MSRLSADRVALAREIMGRYPNPRSALIPLVHLAQEQDGYVDEDAMEHIGELLGATPAEVYGTASFYGMFKFHPVGRYVVDICTNISCLLAGADELLEHAEGALGVRAGATTTDGMFTLEDVECIAACTVAPCVQVNYRYFPNQTPETFDRLLDDLRAGKLEADVPTHGVLARVRQRVGADRWAGTGSAPPPIAERAPGPALGASPEGAPPAEPPRRPQ
jgi:NADH-quinone oxidoreductase subunit E